MQARTMRRRGWVALLAVIALFASMTTTGAAAAIEECSDPPEVFPLKDLEKGMVATGWTVVEGDELTPFQVEIIGVQRDAIVPGFSVIAVRASGAAIDAGGGIAAGFSGSPVYLDGKLVGSMSWVMGYGADPHYGGLTPGAMIVDVLSYPSGRPGRVDPPRTVALREAIRRAIARDEGVRLSQVPAGLHQIPLSLSVSGARSASVRKIERRFERRGTPVIAYGAGSSAVPGTPATRPIEAGDAVAATISYGDITIAGIGTATAVCGDLVVAFGHPFDHAGGRTAGGLNAAEILTTVPGDEPFKLGNVGAFHGRLDQDRMAGIRGIEGVMPALVPVTSTIESLDTGRERSGATHAAVHSAWLRRVAAYHHSENVYAILDAERGTLRGTWAIDLVSHGTSRTVSFDAMLADRYMPWHVWDVTSDAVRSFQEMDVPMRFERIDLDATVTQAILTATLGPAATSSTTEPTLEVRRELDVARGDLVRVRIPVEPRDGGPAVTARISFLIPGEARGDGELEIRIGDPDYSVRADTIDQLAWKLEHQAAQNEIELVLKLRGMERPIVKHLTEDWVLRGETRDVRLNLVAG